MIDPDISLEMIYEDEPFLDRIDRVADHGFDTVEFATWFDKDLDALEERLEENGVSIAAMAAIQETGMPQDFERAMTDPAKRETVVGDIEESIEVARRFDCPNLIVLVGPELEIPREEQFDSIVAALREVAPAAESGGVSLVLEPLNGPVDHPGFFLERSQTGYEIVREVDSPAVELLFDIYHQQVSEGNILANVTSHLDEIGHIHVADVPGRHEPGGGELHYPNIFSTIDDAGYDEIVGFEFTPENDERQAFASIRELVTS
jgi:hydroxypyruvate isomerase